MNCKQSECKPDTGRPAACASVGGICDFSEAIIIMALYGVSFNNLHYL